ncbi:MAG TPA: hypothetical protein P5228_00560 [Bacteroidales bacterium]|nr:hypothetical protein [Bacteroidales bacterium]HRZ48314.1 hypothetical protein [Bacteroidales bacterium]
MKLQEAVHVKDLHTRWAFLVCFIWVFQIQASAGNIQGFSFSGQKDFSGTHHFFPAKKYSFTGSDPFLVGFGGGFSTATLFNRAVDQVFFPGFTAGAGFLRGETILEFRGRFFFGEVDAYQIEILGYKTISPTFPRWFAGGGVGYGGMNQKELLILDLNGMPVPGVFYHNGKGMHAFIGGGVWLYKGSYYGLKGDLEYFISLFNVNKIHTPTGVRLSISVFLHAPVQP